MENLKEFKINHPTISDSEKLNDLLQEALGENNQSIMFNMGNGDGRQTYYTDFATNIELTNEGKIIYNVDANLEKIMYNVSMCTLENIEFLDEEQIVDYIYYIAGLFVKNNKDIIESALFDAAEKEKEALRGENEYISDIQSYRQ